MNRFLAWLVDLLRPWHDDGLPEELQLPENPHWYFTKGSMERAASLTVSQGIQLGVFQILGPTYALKAKNAWRPRELLLMEDVSLAFFEVENRITQGIHVPPIHVKRLALMLCRYCAYHNDVQSEHAMEARITKYHDKMADFYKDWNSEREEPV